MSKERPQLSVVLLTPDGYDRIRRTMRHLRAQTARAELEVVIVAPSRQQLRLAGDELEGFCGHRLVELGEIGNSAEARAAGVRAAGAPIVVFGEDHSYPEPGWAEALLAAHRGPWAAVGPAIANANPERLLSWCNLYLTYGRWVEPVSGGEIDDLPGHNSSYKRDLLLGYGPRLGEILQTETLLHWDLRQRGYQLYLEPRAVTRHVNSARLWSNLAGSYLYGRMFAAGRGRDRPWRRVIHLGGVPLLPVRQVRQVARAMLRRGHRGLFVRVLPLVVLTSLVRAAGEVIGYLAGAGQAAQKLSQFESNRYRELTAADSVTVS